MTDSQTNRAHDKAHDLELDSTVAQPAITDNMGHRLADDDNSLKAGMRGPTLLEDLHFREKIHHFDHERIPERVVHARGAGAHGMFQLYDDSMKQYTVAKVLTDPSLETPVFVRFSTVAGSRGSADTARDVRGFAVKMYTPEGNWDIVGNNIPVFFIQDAIKFPDLIHAAKPEPNNEIPQAATAHDTFWDFISLTPESMHMIMWIMSDRTLPRSFGQMEGFGVHTFRLINAEGTSTYVKFHWKPTLGMHGLVWDEAQRLAGKDPDFHRRDLWESIEMGNYPEWELGVQLFTDDDADKFDFDILDATKIVPEDLVPVRRIGKLTLNRNPENYFSETEQVAFMTSNIVPGIDFSDDPLLQGRNFSYLDTQLSRLGSPNWPELPINRPLANVSNNQRDGHMRSTINKGRVSYQPNSLDGNKPNGVEGGYRGYPEPLSGTKVRMRSETFSDHYGQAKLFWNSMSPVEQEHIIMALQFELSKVEIREIRQRMLGHLTRINDKLATEVAFALGEMMPHGAAAPAPAQNSNGHANGQAAVTSGAINAMAESMPGGTADKGGATAPIAAGVMSPTTASGGLQRTSGLSMVESSPPTTIKGRKVAILVADGVSGTQVEAIKAALKAEGALGEVVAPHLGTITSADGGQVEAKKTFATAASIFYDAVIVPGGAQSVDALTKMGDAREFVAEAFKHAKSLAFVADGVNLLNMADIPGKPQQIKPDTNGEAPGLTGVIVANDVQAAMTQFVAAIAKHRHWTRQQRAQVPA